MQVIGAILKFVQFAVLFFVLSVLEHRNRVNAQSPLAYGLPVFLQNEFSNGAYYLHLLTNVSDCGPLPANVQGREVHADVATQSPKQWKIVSATTPPSTGCVTYATPLVFELLSGGINWQLDLCGPSSPSSCGGHGLQATSAPRNNSQQTNQWQFVDPAALKGSGDCVPSGATTWIQTLYNVNVPPPVPPAQYVGICGGTGGTNGFNLHSTQTQPGNTDLVIRWIPTLVPSHPT